MSESSSTNKKIKLTIVEGSLAIGGVQKLAIDQLRLLDRNIFDIQLITLTQPDRKTFDDEVPDHVKVHKLDFQNIFNIKSLWSLYKVLKEIDPDVVKSSMFFSNTVVRLLKPFIGYKVVAADHNTKKTNKISHKIINKVLSYLTYTIIVDSKMVAEVTAKSDGVPINKYTVIHNGVDMEAVGTSINEFEATRSQIRMEYNIKEDDKLFLTIGRLVEQKNHARMIDAFAQLLKSRKDVKLIIIGDGGLKEELEKRVQELSIGENVTLLGARKDIHRFYAISDFTLLSSDHEGFCIAAMEGLAFGAPLVSTRVAGVSEYLVAGQNGFFADKTPEDLAEKMNIILSLSEAELNTMKQNSKKTADNYSIEKYIKHLEEVFLSCL
jgi:glycosyltransferase involved in cell wall biosynthesis